jgi:hypothetical protein
VLVVVKILLVALIILIIFGDDIFSLTYNFVKADSSAYLMTQTAKSQNYPYISSIEPYYVHYADKVIVKGANLNWLSNNHLRLMSSYGEVKLDSRLDEELIFSIPLNWKIGKVRIWAERLPTKDGEAHLSSNIVEIDVLDRLGSFNDDDIRYFGQIKYLNVETQSINNFENYKLRNYKFSRWIPTKAFELYADIKEFTNKIAIKGK